MLKTFVVFCSPCNHNLMCWQDSNIHLTMGWGGLLCQALIVIRKWCGDASSGSLILEPTFLSRSVNCPDQAQGICSKQVSRLQWLGWWGSILGHHCRRGHTCQGDHPSSPIWLPCEKPWDRQVTLPSPSHQHDRKKVSRPRKGCGQDVHYPQLSVCVSEGVSKQELS